MHTYLKVRSGNRDRIGRLDRTGYHDPHEVVTYAGAVAVRQRRVNDKRVDAATGEGKRFASSISPALTRESQQLYLHGASTSDFTRPRP